MHRVIAVTTAPVSAPAPLARVGTPARKQAAPARQRISTAVLVVGTVLSLASLVGPDWALRAGVVIALVSAARVLRPGLAGAASHQAPARPGPARRQPSAHRGPALRAPAQRRGPRHREWPGGAVAARGRSAADPDRRSPGGGLRPPYRSGLGASPAGPGGRDDRHAARDRPRAGSRAGPGPCDRRRARTPRCTPCRAGSDSIGPRSPWPRAAKGVRSSTCRTEEPAMPNFEADRRRA